MNNEERIELQNEYSEARKEFNSVLNRIKGQVRSDVRNLNNSVKLVESLDLKFSLRFEELRPFRSQSLEESQETEIVKIEEAMETLENLIRRWVNYGELVDKEIQMHETDIRSRVDKLLPQESTDET